LCGNSGIVLKTENFSNVSWASNLGLNSNQTQINVFLTGKYWVDVFKWGCKGSDTVRIVPTTNTVQAIFLASTLDTINKPVQFINLSKPQPTGQQWFFGDGTTSYEFNAEHTYVLPQTFSVTLEVTNGYCSDKVTKEVSAIFRKPHTKQIQQVVLELESLSIYPNPFHDRIGIVYVLNDHANIKVMLSDMNGNMIHTEELLNTKQENSVINFPGECKGVYVLHFLATSAKGTVTRHLKLIKG
jgi:hypothetical protein